MLKSKSFMSIVGFVYVIKNCDVLGHCDGASN